MPDVREGGGRGTVTPESWASSQAAGPLRTPRGQGTAEKV